MSIDTRKTIGRRAVRYSSYGDFLADAERCAKTPARTLGNWTQAQIYKHLAISMDSAIDGTGFALPAPMRWVMSLIMKRKFLHQDLPPGFKATAKFTPADDVALDASLTDLKRAIQRVQSEPHRAFHPAFGKLSREEWDLFNLRHAEMHMSFVQPIGSA